jgi:hypothetical protein
MKIDINANSLKKLVRLLRIVADELDAMCQENRAVKETKTVALVTKDDAAVDDIVTYYKNIHPRRARSVGPSHKDWKLIQKRLNDGYKPDELKAAILENSRRPWWVEQGRHGIFDIMGKDANLDSFIQQRSKGGARGEYGYTAGSKEFNSTIKGFGD